MQACRRRRRSSPASRGRCRASASTRRRPRAATRSRARRARDRPRRDERRAARRIETGRRRRRPRAAAHRTARARPRRSPVAPAARARCDRPRGAPPPHTGAGTPYPPSGQRRTRSPSKRVGDDPDQRDVAHASVASTNAAKRWKMRRPRSSWAAPSDVRFRPKVRGAAAPRGRQLLLAHAFDPRFDLGPVHLEMELRRPGAIAEPERLVRDAVVRREQRRVLRQVEGVHVPLEGRFTVLQQVEQRIAAAAAVRLIDTNPISRSGARCTDRPSAHARACAPKQMPRYGSSPRHRVADHVAHGVEEGLLVGMLGVEGAAEQDHRARVAKVGHGLAADRVPDHVRTVDLGERGRRDPEALIVVGTHEQDRLHRWPILKGHSVGVVRV